MKRIIVVSYKKKYKGFRLACRKQDSSRTVRRTGGRRRGRASYKSLA